MTATILQYFGIGDVIFAQGVAQHLINQGYKVIWPVRPEFIEGLQRAYPAVTFHNYQDYPPAMFDIQKDITTTHTRIIPLRWSERILRMPSKFWMRAKYDLYKLDYTKWKESAVFQRDSEKEESLFNLLTNGEPYNLVNTMFRSDASGGVKVEINNTYRVVEMKIIPGYSLFDYSLLIERATEIHAANSSILYLLELLDLSASEVHLYCRKPDEKDFRYVDYLFTKPYKLHF